MVGVSGYQLYQLGRTMTDDASPCKGLTILGIYSGRSIEVKDRTNIDCEKRAAPVASSPYYSWPV
jgi:hypothetical protein